MSEDVWKGIRLTLDGLIEMATRVWFDLGNCFTLIGILRLSQMIVGILVIICVGIADATVGSFPESWFFKADGISFMYIVPIGAIITTLIIGLVFALHLPETAVCSKLPWNIMELGLSILLAVLYLVCTVIIAAGCGRYKFIGLSGDVLATLKQKNADKLKLYNGGSHAFAAAGFFSASLVVLYMAQVFIQFRALLIGPRPTPNVPK